MAFYRASLIAAAAGVSTMVLAPVAFLSAAFLHLRTLGAVGVLLLALFMASRASLQAFRIRWAHHLGHWTGWHREPIWRNENTVRYWTLTTIHAVFLSIYALVAVFLTRAGLDLLRSN